MAESSEPQASEAAARALDAGGASAPAPRSEPQASEAAARYPVPVPIPPPGGMAVFEAGGLRLALCNAEGAICVIEDRCPHAQAFLSDGRLSGTVLECPLHGGKLDVRDGRPLFAPIRRPVRTFAVRREGERLLVEVPDA